MSRSSRSTNSKNRASSGEQRSRPRKPGKRQLDRRLDEALEETFPASDPVELTSPERRDR